MCDTLCVVRPSGTLFAKNSDRPPGEAQIVQGFARRAAGDELATQYLRMPDDGRGTRCSPPGLRGCGARSTG